MSETYRIFGLEPSPYSVKVRSWFRYKAIAHEWVARTLAREEEFQAHARLPLIPLVVTPQGEGLQDSTPLIEEIERRHTDPATQPADGSLAFLSCLIEEYADEWVNKPMFHYRWTYEADRIHGAAWIAQLVLPEGSEAEREGMAEFIRKRMVPRLGLVGSSEDTRGVIEASYRRQLEILDAHLAHRPYLFGGRPCLADFGYGGQLYELYRDPTPGQLMGECAPHVVAYVQRMLFPTASGGFETWATLGATLTPLLGEEVAGRFLPWSDANARAVADGAERFTVDLGGTAFGQRPGKYHARSLAVLRARYGALERAGWLAAVLAETGCRQWLEGS